MKVHFSDRAFSAIMAETAEKVHTETGGLFLGAVKNDTWYVIETIDPGPNSIFEVAYFEYDQKYIQHLINKVANLYSEKLELIGLWHRHPGSFDIFSGTDDGTNAKYASMRKKGAISALVNIDPKFRLTMYQVHQPCRYEKIEYNVGDELIPNNYLSLKTKKQLESIMYNRLNGINNISATSNTSIGLKSFMDLITAQLKDRVCSDVSSINVSEESREFLIDNTVSDITFMSDIMGIEMSIVQNNGLLALIQKTFVSEIKVVFLCDETSKKIFFRYSNVHYLYEEGLFESAYNTFPDEKVTSENKETHSFFSGLFRKGTDNKEVE